MNRLIAVVIQCLPAHVSSSLCLPLPVLWTVRAPENGLQAYLRCGSATNATSNSHKGFGMKPSMQSFLWSTLPGPRTFSGHCTTSRRGFPGSYWLSTDPDLKEIVHCVLKRTFQSIFQTGSDHHSYRVPNIFLSFFFFKLHNWALAMSKPHH